MNESLPINVEGLSYSISGNQLVDVPKLSITEQGPTVIIGPNGAGKSLLLRLLHGLIVPQRGSFGFGENAPTATVRSRQSMVFQNPVVLRRSLIANVRYALRNSDIPPREHESRMTSLLSRANLLTKAKQSARSLSGGEQQLLSLVRALATEPEILFLDEPTASLAPGATRLIEDMITNAASTGAKVILVSHDLGQARRVGAEILFLHKGKVVEQTAANEFFENPKSSIARQFINGDLVI